MSMADKEVEQRSIDGHETGEGVTYHYKTQKGLGKKCCIAYGVERTEDRV